MNSDREEATAKQNAPFRTGYLRSQIMVDSPVTEKEAFITSNADYSIYQKDDFMGDALESETPTLINELKKTFPNVWRIKSEVLKTNLLGRTDSERFT